MSQRYPTTTADNYQHNNHLLNCHFPPSTTLQYWQPQIPLHSTNLPSVHKYPMLVSGATHTLCVCVCVCGGGGEGGLYTMFSYV
jgi:hypothetical protein